MEEIPINKSTFDDQSEMRSAFLGGFAGQLISGVIWLISALLSALVKPDIGMLFLFFGSMGIFPLTQMALRLMGRPAKVSKKNGLWALGTQIAFTVPINFILVGVVVLYRPIWFYPAAMIVVGSHYLPFITLYGMKMFGLLGALLIVFATLIGVLDLPIFSLGGWLGGGLMLIFAYYGRRLVLKEESGT